MWHNGWLEVWKHSNPIYSVYDFISLGSFQNFLHVLCSNSAVFLNLEAHFFRSGNCIVFIRFFSLFFVLKFFQIVPLGLFVCSFNPDFYLAISSPGDRNNSLECDSSNLFMRIMVYFDILNLSVKWQTIISCNCFSLAIFLVVSHVSSWSDGLAKSLT